MRTYLKVMLLLLASMAFVSLFSCSTTSKYGCGPRPGSKDWAGVKGKVVDEHYNFMRQQYTYILYWDTGTFDTVKRWTRLAPKDSCVMKCLP